MRVFITCCADYGINNCDCGEYRSEQLFWPQFSVFGKLRQRAWRAVVSRTDNDANYE